MTFKKINSQSIASKVTNSKFSTEVEGIPGVTLGNFEVITRSKVTMLGKQTLQVSSTSNSIFESSTPKGSRSFTNALEGGSSVAEKIKKTLSLLEKIGSKSSTTKGNYDLISGSSLNISCNDGRLFDGEASHVSEKGVEVQEIKNPAKQVPLVKEMLVSSEGMIPLDRLKEFIEGTIKDKYEVSTKSSHIYVKPYTIRIDNFKMSAGFQPLKFQ
ncbi:hypothetical protein KY290_001339 [Solanum tuberosum]|uniref:Uncharacterized protein n=1 Tax=Solanum tuberosum TaxID=4113 RepID=A0ABQ7WN84_SOLTU|nr:hypothetical protein KY290_001339 [Solanum tuberosum]